MRSLIRVEILDVMLAVAAAVPPGDFAEVGVYQGGSALPLYRLAQQQKRRLYLFDTFCGMPFADPGDSHQRDDFADVDLRLLRRAMPDAVFCEGVFPETIPASLGALAFAHIDCDQYRSTLAAIDHLWPRLVQGGALWFDDFADVPAAQRAVLARFDESQLRRSVMDRVYVVHD